MDRNHGSCSDDSEIEEERAGGGPGPTGGEPEQEDRGRIRADVYPDSGNAGGAFTNRMTAETLGVRADIVCTYAYGPLRPSRSGIDSF